MTSLFGKNYDRIKFSHLRLHVLLIVLLLYKIVLLLAQSVDSLDGGLSVIIIVIDS